MHPAKEWMFSIDLHNNLVEKMLLVLSFDTWYHWMEEFKGLA